jgi:elongation factor P
MMQIKLRNLKTGRLAQKRFRPADKVEVVFVEKKELEYLYRDSSGLVFMDTETYEQTTITPELLGDGLQFLKPNIMCSAEFYDGKMINVTMPDVGELQVTETDPVVKGQTATNQYKPATLETGVRVTVPPFISKGEVVRVDFCGLTPPDAACVGEVPNQFFLLRVHAQDGRARLQEGGLLGLDVAELPVAVRVGRAGEALEAGAQREAPFFSRRRTVSLRMRWPRAPKRLASSLRLERTHFFPLHGSPAVSGLTNLARSASICGSRLSARGRPPPGLRIRPARQAAWPVWISRRPRRIVWVCMPVSFDRRVSPPQPQRRDSRPTQCLRWRSLSVSRDRKSVV